MGATTGDWAFYLGWLFLAFMVNVAYNKRPLILSRRGPWELPCMATGNFLVPILSCKLNSLPLPPLGSWLFHLCMLWRTHIWFEIMDMYDDAKTDKKTVAVKVGHKWACAMVIGLTLAEAAVGYYMLHCVPLSLFSLSGVAIFLSVEVLPIPESLVPQDKTSKKMMSNVQSLGGILLLFYVWSTGVFVNKFMASTTVKSNDGEGLVLSRPLKTSVSYRVEVERALKLARVLITIPSCFDPSEVDVKVKFSSGVLRISLSPSIEELVIDFGRNSILSAVKGIVISSGSITLPLAFNKLELPESCQSALVEDWSKPPLTTAILTCGRCGAELVDVGSLQVCAVPSVVWQLGSEIKACEECGPLLVECHKDDHCSGMRKSVTETEIWTRLQGRLFVSETTVMLHESHMLLSACSCCGKSIIPSTREAAASIGLCADSLSDLDDDGGAYVVIPKIDLEEPICGYSRASIASQLLPEPMIWFLLDVADESLGPMVILSKDLVVMDCLGMATRAAKIMLKGDRPRDKGKLMRITLDPAEAVALRDAWLQSKTLVQGDTWVGTIPVTPKLVD
ncbi:hypothetical protein FOL47_001844 [Perkinsus chesapeaki]|uniref:Uncharacterized protein n=1 Tax=Perkinsus chesapeaki TaxID=330153 RepID=A0A7J6MH64_PERCH|nr:hypothetical protein FOL47_001844 [Perkinsus chesapeaki]